MSYYFKNNNFDSSEVMRSFEKVAINKKLIDIDSIIKKQASSNKEQELPKTFMDKIVALCNGLRDKNLNKYADEIEIKFLMYKKAENALYDVSKEKGEDVIDFAHPEGSKKLDKKWSDLGEVETILDQHSKILDVVNKLPKGKLSSNNIINAVKLSLGQNIDIDTILEQKDESDIQQEKAQQYLFNLTNQTTKLLNRIIASHDLSDITYHDPGFEGTESPSGFTIKTTKGHLEILLAKINDLSKRPADINSVDVLKSILNAANTIINKADNIDQKNKTKYTVIIRNLYNLSDNVLKILRGEDKEASPQAEKKPQAVQQTQISKSDFLSKVNADKTQAVDVSNQLTSFIIKPSIANDEQKLNFVQAVDKAVQNYIKDLNKIIESLSNISEEYLSPDKIFSVMENTSIFQGINNYNKFKETASNFHNAVNQRIKLISSW